jgi:hypothetical protein
VEPLLADSPFLRELEGLSSGDRDAHFYWKRPGSLFLPGTPGTWGLTLDLLTSANQRRGSMQVHRLYNERPLQLDVNLLISEFPVALADALERVLGCAMDMAANTNAGQNLIQAQAG